MSSVSKTDDRRVAIDITIVKLSCGLVTRWRPKELMLADGPTNGQMDPADLLRSALHVGEYQLRAETSVLDQKRRMRDERDRRKFKQIYKQSLSCEGRSNQKTSRNSVHQSEPSA